MTPDVQSLLQTGAALTDAALERLLPAPTVEPHSIHRAMRHSTFAGGKRLRPILCMEAARMVSGTLPEGAAELGAAIEMVHTYSLIHDDLPALDNDDLRRGQPTCHVAFGEAIAILAGDALQTLAFQTLAQLPAPPATIVEIIRQFSLAIGTGVGPLHPTASRGEQELPPGMIGGQVMDIESEGQKPTAELVESIHRAKTGALITTSIVCGGLLSLGASESLSAFKAKPGAASSSALKGTAFRPSIIKQPAKGALAPEGNHADLIARLRTFGEKAGLAFQIVDDILDVTQSSEQLGKTAGKDTAADKATWPAVFGLDQSRRDANELIADAFAALEPFGASATPLKSLAQYLVDRTH
jgi:geranylgeranyl diphosphate synthase type II